MLLSCIEINTVFTSFDQIFSRNWLNLMYSFYMYSVEWFTPLLLKTLGVIYNAVSFLKSAQKSLRSSLFSRKFEGLEETWRTLILSEDDFQKTSQKCYWRSLTCSIKRCFDLCIRTWNGAGLQRSFLPLICVTLKSHLLFLVIKK